jgi:hypothetical protein
MYSNLLGFLSQQHDKNLDFLERLIHFAPVINVANFFLKSFNKPLGLHMSRTAVGG